MEFGELSNGEQFTVLENKTIGRNLYKFRKIKDKKASDVAKYIGLGETAYTKYERGESKITIDLIQKVAEFYKIDPLQLLSTTASSHFVENVQHSPFAINGTVQTTNDEQTKIMLKLIESVISLSERVAALIEGKKR
jgi:transcriptional regulator with XRE-family HTH domain